MHSKLILFFAISLVLFSCTPQKEKTTTDTEEIRSLSNPIFVFNNAFNNNEVQPISLEDQAVLLKELDFDGIEHREVEGLLEIEKVFKNHGLNIYTDYMKIDIDEEPHYLPEWKDVIPKLKGSNIILWTHIHSKKYDPSDESADEEVVNILRELADFAKPYGVRIAIYPHTGFLAEKSDDSYRLAVKADRTNVGSVFNLCHFLKTEKEENLKSAISRTFPKLFAVSISGADRGDTQSMNWDQLIQPLGDGSFDVYRVVELLADKGYTGPIGVQCFNIPGDPAIYLKKSSTTWEKWEKQFSRSPNTLTETEKQEGWQLLFDGESIEHWKGINQDSFPASGWEVTNGKLIAKAADGDESGNGGDILTKKKYGQFMLKWDWLMETKGGNSGVKYFVQEGIGDNTAYGYGLEYQILDDNNHEWMLNGKMQPNDYHTIGALYELYPASADKRPSPLGLWNTSMIVCEESSVEHWLNGHKILEYDRTSDDFKDKIAQSKFKDVPDYGTSASGHILLQDHGSTVQYRNIKIKELP